MKSTFILILVLVIVGAVGVITIIVQSKKINELEFKALAQPKVEIQYRPGKTETIIQKVPVKVLDKDSLKTAIAKWVKEHPRIVETDTVWLNGEQLEVADLDTTFQDSSRIEIRYWLPPASYFDISYYPMIRTEKTTVTTLMKKSPWGFAASVLTGKQSNQYHIGMTGTLYFRQIGISGYFDSQGLTMAGLSVLW